jgi:cytochrome c
MKIINLIAFFALLVVSGCAQDGANPAAADADSAAATAGQSGADGLEALLANADPDMGQRQFIYCQACHTTEPGGGNKVGPNLAGVIGRPAAQADGFVYSPALSEADLVWDVATLDQWIDNPAALVPGTTMVFAGIMDAQQRANLIAYLREATGSTQ